jgi:hypothetical protein
VEIVFVAHISTVYGPAVFITRSVVVLIHGHISVERIGISNTITTVVVISGCDAALPIAGTETIDGFTKAHNGVTIVAGINRFYTN